MGSYFVLNEHTYKTTGYICTTTDKCIYTLILVVHYPVGQTQGPASPPKVAIHTHTHSTLPSFSSTRKLKQDIYKFFLPFYMYGRLAKAYKRYIKREHFQIAIIRKFIQKMNTIKGDLFSFVCVCVCVCVCVHLV